MWTAIVVCFVAYIVLAVVAKAVFGIGVLYAADTGRVGVVVLGVILAIASALNLLAVLTMLVWKLIAWINGG